MSKIENVSRRDVLRAGTYGGVFVLATSLTACGDASNGTMPIAKNLSTELEELNLFISINEQGTVQVLCHRAEMGQHARTGLARVVADELEADWDKVVVVQTEGSDKYGDQNTDGSTTIRADFDRLRRIGASARSMLERAAAEKWGISADKARAFNGEVINDETGDALSFGALAKAASALEPPAFEGEAFNADAPGYKLKSPEDWRYIGKKTAHVDLEDILHGKAVYGQDVTLPDMKIAVIARPAVLFGKVKSFNADKAKAIAGVLEVIEVPTGEFVPGFSPVGGVAVIAENTWAAIEGKRALEVEWDDGDNSDYDSNTYRAELEASVNQPQKPVRDKGDIDAAFDNAAQTFSADYYVPHLSHAQMEPPAALATYTDGKIDVWTSTQNPQQARLDLATLFAIDYANITVNNALLGGAFGRKSKPDFVYEAALLARATGWPIKVVWTREDDMHNGFLHAVSAQHVEAAIDANGAVTGWRHRVSYPSITSTFDPRVDEGSPLELGLGLLDIPFSIDNIRVENGKAKGKTRIGWLRSVNNIQHAFAVQSFVGELAHLLGKDPKDFLLDIIGDDRQLDMSQEGLLVDYHNYFQSIDDYPIDTGRLKNVINIAADGIGWRSDMPTGKGMGIAGHRSFNSYVATAMEVSVDDNGVVNVPRVVVACDCGIAVNPDTVVNQMQGASVFGMSNMLESAITFSNGAVDQNNFDTYRVLRMNSAPKNIDVKLVNSGALPGGVGEPGTPPFMPAMANAIFAATGKRIRALPIGDQLSA